MLKSTRDPNQRVPMRRRMNSTATCPIERRDRLVRMPRTWRRSWLYWIYFHLHHANRVRERQNELDAYCTPRVDTTRQQSERCGLICWEICVCTRASIMMPSGALSRRAFTRPLTRPPNTCQLSRHSPTVQAGGGERERDSTLDVLVVCFTPVAAGPSPQGITFDRSDTRRSITVWLVQEIWQGQ